MLSTSDFDFCAPNLIEKEGRGLARPSDVEQDQNILARLEVTRKIPVFQRKETVNSVFGLINGVPQNFQTEKCFRFISY